MTGLLAYINKESEVGCVAIGPKKALELTKVEADFIRTLETTVDAAMRNDYDGGEDFFFLFADHPTIAEAFRKIAAGREKRVLAAFTEKYDEFHIPDAWSKIEFYKHSENEMYAIRFTR